METEIESHFFSTIQMLYIVNVENHTNLEDQHCIVSHGWAEHQRIYLIEMQNEFDCGKLKKSSFRIADVIAIKESWRTITKKRSKHVRTRDLPGEKQTGLQVLQWKVFHYLLFSREIYVTAWLLAALYH